MKKLILCCLAVFCQATFVIAAQPLSPVEKGKGMNNEGTRTVRLKLVETSDVHGSFLPYDFINNRPLKGSMGRVASYVNRARQEYGNNLILLDNGDILQGQPTCYYYNYINTTVPNIASEILNFMGYDAVTFGNHDIETGHATYDKWVKELNCPVLAANMIDTLTGQPYTKPYTIIEREGVKVAVVGMITPAVPNWLGETLWSGLRFENMLTSAQQWIKHIKENEQPDVIVGLFHCGWDGGIATEAYNENEAGRIAREIPDFDIIFYGHDHTIKCGKTEADNGKATWFINPSSNATHVGVAEIEIDIRDNAIVRKDIKGSVVSVKDEQLDEAFTKRFQPHSDSIRTYANRKIGSIDKTITTFDSFFGSSAFTDLIHNLQLAITKADISFCAPLSFNAVIKEGPITVSDMFKLYKYENKVCIVKMSGKEIKGYLEMSYALWTNTMASANDHIMLFDEGETTDTHRFAFKNPTFNFDSAVGIDYVVDVTKPEGSKVEIMRMSNGQPFSEEQTYTVAVNSYRANGGGELLTRGAGIAKDSLESRIVYQSELDMRHYLMKEIERIGNISPTPNNNWRFVPEAWATEAIKRDREKLNGGF